MKRRLFLGIACAALMLGCGGEEKQETAAPVKTTSAAANTASTTLKINMGAEPRTLDPSKMTDVVGSICMMGLMEYLVETDLEGKDIPRAAETFTHNDDYTVWTFKLRPGIRWHNGDPVTAHDYVYGVERICTPSTGGEYASYTYSFLKGGKEFFEGGGLDKNLKLQGVRAADDMTVVYELANPTPFFISVMQLFTWLPVHKPTVDKHGVKWADSPETFNGMGPMKLTSYRSKDVIVLEKADTYWNKENVFWNRVELYMIENETTENNAFLSKELDVTSAVAIPELDYWRDKPEYHLYHFYAMQYTGFNNQRAPFDDVNVRKAFSHAIDRKLLTTRVTRRNEPIAQGIIPAGLPSPRGGEYRDHAGNLLLDHNPEKAREYFAKAGYGPGGKAFPAVEYMYDTSEENKMIAEQLQAMWRETLGVEVRLQNVEWGVRLARTQSGDYDIARLRWYGDYLDAMTFLELFLTTSTMNSPKFSNPRYDELVEAGRAEGDPIKREALLADAERILVQEDCGVAPLFSMAVPILMQQGIKNVGRSKLGGLQYNMGRRE